MDFEVLNSVEKMPYVLGSELWEQISLYGDDSCPNPVSVLTWGSVGCCWG